ncbi:peptidase domain-containing ABC transporter [Aquirufa salirivi]|uniref:Peptidase domain-containing ABC transporter n=1 Tax=Aquirufa salirivi TaxID=3104729 RepID=A0ABW8RQ42_9BACT
MKKPIIVQQQGTSDCGVACLLSILRYFGGNNKIENLRQLSGTTLQGTSMLGLKQASEKLGMDAEAYEIEDVDLFKMKADLPCIIHLLMEGNMEHYVICYKIPTSKSDFYLIGDPAFGFREWTEEKILSHWKSRVVLFLRPNKHFVYSPQTRFSKVILMRNLIKNDIHLLIIASVMGIIIAALGMSTAIFTQNLLDHILPEFQFKKLYLGLFLFVLIGLAKSGIGYLRGVFLIRQAREFNIRIMDDFYGKLFQLPSDFFISRKTGEIITRINDTRRIQELISYLFGSLIIDLLVVFTSVIFIFYYSSFIGFISLFTVPLFICLMSIFHRQIIDSQKEVMSSSAMAESHFVDVISGIHSIKAVNKENFFIARGKQFYQNFQNKVFNLGFIANTFGLWSEFASNIIISIILGFCSLAVLNNQIKLGEMMAIVAIGANLINAVSRLTNSNIRLQEATIALERMHEFSSNDLMNTDGGKSNELISSEFKFESLKINNLSFRFSGRLELFSHINLELKNGELLIVLGEIGSGKSILLQILQKIYNYDSGSILIDNKELRQIDSIFWRNQIGIVGQEIKIFSSTIIENIILDDVLSEHENVIKFCEYWGFDMFFKKLPNSYMTIVGENGVQLSGGQKQLVGLVRALYRRPKILLLDEPTSSLDEKTEKFVFDVLGKLKSEMAILMVTHRGSVISNADKIFEFKSKTLVQMK